MSEEQRKTDGLYKRLQAGVLLIVGLVFVAMQLAGCDTKQRYRARHECHVKALASSQHNCNDVNYPRLKARGFRAGD